jgi:hypothetical protein
MRAFTSGHNAVSCSCATNPCDCLLGLEPGGLATSRSRFRSQGNLHEFQAAAGISAAAARTSNDKAVVRLERRKRAVHIHQFGDFR